MQSCKINKKLFPPIFKHGTVYISHKEIKRKKERKQVATFVWGKYHIQTCKNKIYTGHIEKQKFVCKYEIYF